MTRRRGLHRARPLLAIVIIGALGCGSPSRSVRFEPTKPVPPDPRTLRTLLVDAEQAESSADATLATLRQGGPENFTITDARKFRSEIGHIREEAVESLRKVPDWPETAEVRAHLRAALVASEKACDYLDGVIAKLQDPDSRDELTLASLRKLGECERDWDGGRAKCADLEARIALKKYGAPQPAPEK